MKNILITGGAGFIGTNLTVSLIDCGKNIVIVDDFKNSYKSNIDKLSKLYKNKIKVIKHDVRDYDFLKQVVQENNIDAIMHLAAKKYIDESFLKPKQYHDNNMQSLQTALCVAHDCKIKNIMFASTMAVYGNPTVLPIPESAKYNPISPYAETKVLGEQEIISWTNNNQDASVIIYRFSNPIGADDKLMLGDNAKRPNNSLLPYIIENALVGNSLVFNGNNHSTRDGTPIRDYIHIKDLTNIVAKTFTTNNAKGLNIYNVGCGKDGFTVLQMLKAVETCLDKKLNYSFGPKRSGDIERLVCDNTKLKQDFDIKLDYSLEDMVSSHINFIKYLKTKK